MSAVCITMYILQFENVQKLEFFLLTDESPSSSASPASGAAAGKSAELVAALPTAEPAAPADVGGEAAGVGHVLLGHEGAQGGREVVAPREAHVPASAGACKDVKGSYVVWKCAVRKVSKGLFASQTKMWAFQMSHRNVKNRIGITQKIEKNTCAKSTYC